MNPQLIETIIGCLLHDIGKPVQRAALGYRGRHSAIGRAFMKKVWLRDSRNPSEFTERPAPGRPGRSTTMSDLGDLICEVRPTRTA